MKCVNRNNRTIDVESEGTSPVAAAVVAEDPLANILLVQKFAGAWPYDPVTGEIQLVWFIYSLLIVICGLAKLAYLSYVCFSTFPDISNIARPRDKNELAYILILSGFGISIVQSIGTRFIILTKHKEIPQYLKAIRQFYETNSRNVKFTKFRKQANLMAIGSICIFLVTTVLSFAHVISFYNVDKVALGYNESSLADIYQVIFRHSRPTHNGPRDLLLTLCGSLIISFLVCTVIGLLIYVLSVCKFLKIMFEVINEQLEARLSQRVSGNESAGKAAAEASFHVVFGLVHGLIQLTVIMQNLISFYMFITRLISWLGLLLLLFYLFCVSNVAQILACYLPARVTDEAHSCELLLYQFLSKGVASDTEKEEINLFLSRLSSRRVALHVSHYYYIDRSLILTVYSILLSYLLVMLQLSPKVN